MNKSLFIGMGIFFTILVVLLSVSLTINVNAQAILTNNTNLHISNVLYQLNITELNLSNQYYVNYDILSNTTISTNITVALDYACSLNINNVIYGYNDSTSNFSNIILVNTTLATSLSDGRYNGTLGCMYYINTTNQTSNYIGNQTINQTASLTIINFSAITITTQKTILIDTTPPNIFIDNTSEIYLYNGTNNITAVNILLNFTVSDISKTNCTIIINNISSNVLSNVSNTSTNVTAVIFSVPMILNLTIGNYSYNISCIDELNNVNTVNSIIEVISNVSNNVSNISLDTPFFNIDVSQSAFNLGELGYYYINATNGSNVSITICPIASGWVQCFMTPTFVEDVFPKTQALPYTNKTGRYVISGVMRYKNYTFTRNATYDTTNTLTATIAASESTGVIGDIITFNATASSGIGAYTYKWTMHDGTTFTGPGAYMNYTAVGSFRVNLTVSDNVGNNYTTYFDVAIRDAHTLTVIVLDARNNARIPSAEVSVDNTRIQTDTSGVATFRLAEDTYKIRVETENYSIYGDDVTLDADKTIYANVSFQDLTPPSITLLTASDLVLTKDAVDLKFKATDSSKMTCSLYTANVNDSWYTLKDSGDSLLSDTEYTFEVRDLDNGAYKWKIECSDASNNSIYSDERTFIVSDGNITVALQSNVQNSDDINTALDNMDKLTGDESSVADILNIKSDLKDLLDRMNRLDRDIHDLAYRRDLDANGIKEAQNNLTQTIDTLKNNIPMTLSITDSKTFVKYVHDDDLKSILDDYLTSKNLKLDKRTFLDSIKSVQSKIVVSTNVRNVRLYYLDGRTQDITLVTKDIQAAKPEESSAIATSNTITYLEVIPKTITQTVKNIDILTTDFTIIKSDPMIEFPPDTKTITYYINGTINLDEFQNSDTILIDKNIKTMSSTTGLSILGISSLSGVKIEGQGVMIIIIVLLIIFYLVVNFDLIDKIRNLNIGFIGPGSKKKVSFIRVLVNDALDYLGTEDYDKASLVYREIKLSYEEANEYVKTQVYDESFDLCNQLDMQYALKILDKIEYYMNINDRNSAMIEFDKLENTYNKLSEQYQLKIEIRFKRILAFIKNNS